jgi:isoleucyl-tRNA synthetase
LSFLLANTSDFDPEKDSVASESMSVIDQYAMAMAARTQGVISDAYDRYDFHAVMSTVQAFCTEELGGFWLDVLKDRLYTTRADSRARRSAQTALWQVTQALLRWIAPILSFTAEEAFPLLNPKQQVAGARTIFSQTWHSLPVIEHSGALLDEWDAIRALRAEVLKAIESERAAGRVGSSLQAEVTIRIGGESYQRLAKLGDDLKFVLIVSKASLERVENSSPQIIVNPSEHAKCERCWHWRADVNTSAKHPGLCGRCIDNLDGVGETRAYA